MKKEINTSEKIIIVILSVLLIVCSGLIFVGGIFSKIDWSDIPDFSSFFRREQKEIPQTQLPNIQGFETTKIFSEQTPLRIKPIGEYLLVEFESGTYLTKTFDEFFRCSQTLFDEQVIDGKYIVGEGARLGLKTIFQEEILAQNYDSISFAGETIVAERDGIYSIYYGHELKFQSHLAARIAPNWRYVEIEQSFYDLESADFRLDAPITLDDLIESDEIFDSNIIPFSLPNDEIFMIYDTQNALLGFADKYGILIEPCFTSANDFYNGFANAKINSQSFYISIDAERNIIITNVSERLGFNAIVGGFVDDYALYRAEGEYYYGVIDKEYNIILEPFLEMTEHEILEGAYIIDPNINQFFSIRGGQYVGERYGSIGVGEGFYVCANEGFEILGLDLQCLTDESVYISNAVLYNGGLIVVIDELYYFLLA